MRTPFRSLIVAVTLGSVLGSDLVMLSGPASAQRVRSPSAGQPLWSPSNNAPPATDGASVGVPVTPPLPMPAPVMPSFNEWIQPPGSALQQLTPPKGLPPPLPTRPVVRAAVYCANDASRRVPVQTVAPPQPGPIDPGRPGVPMTVSARTSGQATVPPPSGIQGPTVQLPAPRAYPGQPYPGQQYPGQSFPGQSYPGQSYPGQPYPGSQYGLPQNPALQGQGPQFPTNQDPRFVSPETGLPQDIRLPVDSRALADPSLYQPEPFSTIESAFNAAPMLLGTVPTELRQYGYTVFSSEVSSFAPVDDVPVGPDYVVGPGDDLAINVWGPVDSTIVRTVDRSGRIVLPKIGDLRVWGLTFSEADRLIREQLSRYFRGFQTSVTMGRLRTVRVHVVGEVCQPGVYTLSSLATLTNALYAAGGPTKLGSLRQVRLLRNHHEVGTLDLYDFLLRGDRTKDFRLESGDTVFVPTIGDVAAVAGEVKRPAIYEIRGEVRVADLLAMAGGVTPLSYLKRVQLVRTQPSAERTTSDIDLTAFYLKRDQAENPVVSAGDLVLIHRSDARVYNVVKVDGAVKYPGAYELKPMMRLSHLLTPDRLLPEAFTDRVEIARRRADLSTEIVSVNLKQVWEGDPERDLLLKPLDEISVRTVLRQGRTVTLSGQVARPGRYPIAEDERLSSVLERAGGFTDRAYLKGAVFTREQLKKTEQERFNEYIKLQEQRLLAQASTTIVGAEKEEVQSQAQALQAQREALSLLASRIVLGRMVVQLEAPDKLRGTGNDVVLIDGDALDVPEPLASVLVVGAVRTSTSVQFAPDGNVEYYINRVGGFTPSADEKQIHVVKADGSAVSSFTKIRVVEPGDTIVVPPKEEEKIRALPTARDILHSIGSTLVSFAVLLKIF